MALLASPRAPRAPKAPATDPERRTRLQLVNAKALAARTQRRQARAIALLAALFVVGGLMVVVTGQALVASQQVHLDNLRGELQRATASNENLQLQRAQLSAPTQVLQIAAAKLHMVSPSGVTYLRPVAPGPSVAAHAAAVGR